MMWICIMSAIFHCYYCHLMTDFQAVIHHMIKEHPQEKIKVRQWIQDTTGGKLRLQSKSFGNVVPNELKRDGKICIPNSKTFTLLIEDESPPEKKLKTDNDKLLTNTTSENVQPINTSDENEDILSEMKELLPGVISSLKESGRLDSWLKYNRLLHAGKLPLNNIAYMLFEDVVEWYSLENTSRMRYRKEIKQFWRIGQKLFHRKFLRFMSGVKNTGQFDADASSVVSLKPEDSKINFAVPSRRVLDKLESTFKEAEGPGIFNQVLAKVSESVRGTALKLCVDGKKINAGTLGQKHGDIDLFGYENSPSLKERHERLSREIALIKDAAEEVENEQISNNIEYANDLSDTFKCTLSRKVQFVITILSLRLKDLREMKIGKVRALNKFKQLATGDWRQSKYLYVISAIQSTLYQINDSIDGTVALLNKLGSIASQLNNVQHLFCTENRVCLAEQQNYVCLTGGQSIKDDQSIVEPELVKQRSELWFQIRKEAKVTGSTMNKALGLDTLKSQTQHFDNVVNNVPTPEPSAFVKERMDYGSANEIHAIATLVSKFMPVFHPQITYVEEGCYVIQHGSKPFAVISPDGSGRKPNCSENTDLGHPILAVEAKCPFPGKQYTTDIYYKLPKYYVPQVLSEMKAMDAKELLFICYSKETSSFFRVTFSEELWNCIWLELITLYGQDNPIRPKSKSDNLKKLIESVKSFVDQNVEFVAEMSSVEAKECEHSEQTAGHHFHTEKRNSTNTELVEISYILQLLATSEKCIYDVYELCRTRAVEVLVFLIADLNRFYKEEMPHAIPVAYGLKGYSLNVETLRSMLLDILQRCHDLGMYVPVVSFDGQWSRITVRSASGKPLTLLQLQKDVWAEATKESKSSILKILFSLNVVPVVSSLEELKPFADVVETVTREKKTQMIVGSVTGNNKPYQMNKELHNSLKNMASSKGSSSEKDQDDERSTSNVNILDTIAPNNNVILDDDIVEQATSMSADTAIASQVPEPNMAIDLDMELNEDSMTADILLKDPQLLEMLNELKDVAKVKKKWENVCFSKFKDNIKSEELLKKYLTKAELQICFKSMKPYLKKENVSFSLSWPKDRLVKLFVSLQKHNYKNLEENKSRRKRLPALKKLCQNVIRRFPKHILNIIYAYHIFPPRLYCWRKHALYKDNMRIIGVSEPICWYSQPEFVPQINQYIYALLDAEHLFVNARAKVCRTGIPDAGLKREAWLKVAQESKQNGTGLSLSIVEDLVDRQKCSFAEKVFCEEVEREMKRNGDMSEATFCEIIRNWYKSEDDPGIAASVRCERRIQFRNWLLDGVKFNTFPAPGLFVKGIPHIMFEGFMNNIDRRLQLFPMVPSGSYCVRSLGSLECENLFGSFQELDPKGTGVMNADDIPVALNTALDILEARMDPNRCFFMHTSKAKCYPMHELNVTEDAEPPKPFVQPAVVKEIYIRDHYFDMPERSKRKPKRKSGEIHGPNMSASGCQPVRQHHKCDQSKILPHKRLGVKLTD